MCYENVPKFCESQEEKDINFDWGTVNAYGELTCEDAVSSLLGNASSVTVVRLYHWPPDSDQMTVYH